MDNKKNKSFKKGKFIKVKEVHHWFMFRWYEYTKIKILIYSCHLVAYGSITFLLGFLTWK